MANRRERRTQSNKKRSARIYVDAKDIVTTKIKNIPDGNKLVEMTIASGYYQTGYYNEAGKLKLEFQSPNFFIETWLDELKFDGYFCFVDTNRTNPPNPINPQLVYATGWYIFKISELEFIKDSLEDATWIKWKTEPTLTNFGIYLNPDDGSCYEKRGWQLAISEMKKIGVNKAKIFIDNINADQNDLEKLNKELPNGWQYFYVTSNSAGTWFNKIFKRLDSAINTITQKGPNEYDIANIEQFLKCNTDSLLKKNGTF